LGAGGREFESRRPDQPSPKGFGWRSQLEHLGEGCPSKPHLGRSRTGAAMFYVYMLQSINNPKQKYTGFTSDLKKRFASHNNGETAHTAKYMPWQLVGYHAFEDKKQALDFEHYLKSGSGKAFANKRLWPK
jgi:putative endonuclease